MATTHTPPVSSPISPRTQRAIALPTPQVLDLMAKHGLSDTPIVKTMAFLADVAQLLTPAAKQSPESQLAERLIQATVPAGSICDPQLIADNIRIWLTENEPLIAADARRFVYMLDAEYRCAQTFDPAIIEADFIARRRAVYDAAIAVRRNSEGCAQ